MPVRAAIGDRAEAECRLGDDARHLLRHPAVGIVDLHDADEGVHAVADQAGASSAARDDPDCGRATAPRTPAPSPRRRESICASPAERRARERMQDHQRRVDQEGDQPRLRRMAAALLRLAERPPHQQADRDGERRDANVETNALRAGQEQQRRNRRLADDEDTPRAPNRRTTAENADAEDDGAAAAGAGLVNGLLIHVHDIACEPIGIEAAHGRGSRAACQGARADRRPQTRRAMTRDRSAASPGVCVSASTSGSTSSAAPPDALVITRAATRHRLGDHQAERLRARARVHDDVERAHRGRRRQKAGEGRRDSRRPWSAPMFAVRRASTDCRTCHRARRRRRSREPAASDGSDAIARRKTSCPFHRANVATSPTRTTCAGADVQSGARVEILRPVRRAQTSPDRPRCARPRCGADGESTRLRSSATLAELAMIAAALRSCARSKRPRDAARADVVVDVPHKAWT